MNLKLIPNKKDYWEFIRLLRADERVQSGFIQNTSKISQEQQEKYMPTDWLAITLMLTSFPFKK